MKFIFAIALFLTASLSAFAEDLHVRLNTTKGDVVIRLFHEVAPEHVLAFMSLVRDGLYTNMPFHNVAGRLVEAGDPVLAGKEGVLFSIQSEFSNLKHIRGTVGMARKWNDINSAAGQFYIVKQDAPEMDGVYTVFGEVVKGMFVVDELTPSDKIISAELGSYHPQTQ